MIAWLDSLRADAIFGWRQLSEHRTTSAAAILSLGLAIGACTAAFRLFDALFLKPLPISDPQCLYTISRSGGGFGDGWEYMRFLKMREAMKGEADLIAVSFPEQTDLAYSSSETVHSGPGVAFWEVSRVVVASAYPNDGSQSEQQLCRAYVVTDTTDTAFRGIVANRRNCGNCSRRLDFLLTHLWGQGIIA